MLQCRSIVILQCRNVVMLHCRDVMLLTVCDVILTIHGVLSIFLSEFYARRHRKHTISVTKFGPTYLATSAVTLLSRRLDTVAKVELLHTASTSVPPLLTQQFC